MDFLESQTIYCRAFSVSVAVITLAFYVSEHARSDSFNNNTVHASGEAQTLYPVNEAGETYGKPVDSIHPPDLIMAQGTDGKLGYVRSSELIGDDPATPEEAAKYQLTLDPKGRVIPLYEHDGITIIGEFKIGNP